MMSPFLKKTNQAGFTFLEMMIAVTILASIALFTSRMIESGISSKRKIQGMIDRTSGVRDVIGLMHRDISQAFHYQDLSTEIFNAAQTERRKKAQEEKNKAAGGAGGASPPPTDPNAPPIDIPIDPEIAEKYPTKEIVNYTAFEGDESTLNFSSLNNFRPTRDSQTSSQAEIGYSVESCTNRKTKVATQCLFRRSTPYIDEEIKVGGKKQVLLENVKSLKFRYLIPGDTEDVWKKTWSSNAKDSSDGGKFPIAVEINLTVEEEVKTAKSESGKKEVSLTMLAPILFPNNKEEVANAGQTQGP